MIGSTRKKPSWKKFMKLAGEQAAGFWNPRPPSLDAVLARLEGLSLKPEFALQRQLAHESLRRSLKNPNSPPSPFFAIFTPKTGN